MISETISGTEKGIMAGVCSCSGTCENGQRSVFLAVAGVWVGGGRGAVVGGSAESAEVILFFSMIERDRMME